MGLCGNIFQCTIIWEGVKMGSIYGDAEVGSQVLFLEAGFGGLCSPEDKGKKKGKPESAVI
uniref:Uncharacterized protein n=1 Tax=Anguilla anguilla TaxID=7936 RepID=A0A0E9WZ87_ANGAN